MQEGGKEGTSQGEGGREERLGEGRAGAGKLGKEGRRKGKGKGKKGNGQGKEGMNRVRKEAFISKPKS